MVIEIIDDLNHLPENDRKAVIGLVRALARNRRAEDDAAVTAYRRWEAARKAELGFYQNQPENEPFDSNPDLVAAEHAETEAMLELARTVPTTPEGLAC
ncbi:MAG TPA: hypothetical protein VMM59_00365, partial [Thermohalobaculum sp.]|nr:hypothetical protein [Thermohalobaculum sp.]